MTDVELYQLAKRAESRDRAVALLDHYIGQLYQRLDFPWDADNTAEMGQLVDAIVDAVPDDRMEG